ncbi:MAG TPA: hypothetical protein VML55_17115 [Planctomycetaceae bacterium]|nr:hypothetical protein [Planctomycetaceae bacterium]
MKAKEQSGRQTHVRIRDTSTALARIDPSQVASALDAEPVDFGFSGGGGPLSLFQIRQELLDRLRSTGGRPSLAEASRRAKIPLSAAQWKELEGIAAEVASPGFAPSAGQIASVLLSLSLRTIRSARQENHVAATKVNG